MSYGAENKHYTDINFFQKETTKKHGDVNKRRAKSSFKDVLAKEIEKSKQSID